MRDGQDRRARRPLSSGELGDVLSALAHPARRRIVASLHGRGGIMTAGEIADRFQHSWPTTTRHLGVLREARVLRVHKDGRNRLYALRADALLQASDWLREVASGAAEGPVQRREWADLPYARMRNATPPGGEDDTGSGTA